MSQDSIPAQGDVESQESIGEGDFDHQLEIETGDELEGLAGRFNAMATKLKASYTSLEERVRERTRELQRSNEQLRRLFDGITDGISVIDRNYKIVNANKGIAKLVGKSEKELRGSKCFRSYNAGDAPCEGCPAAETFEKGKVGLAVFDTNKPIYFDDVIINGAGISPFHPLSEKVDPGGKLASVWGAIKSQQKQG